MKKTSTINNFKNYAYGCFSPKHIKNHVKKLSENEFETFYNDVKLAASYLIDEEYLFYKLYWILKYPYDDLCRELYQELYCNIENYNLDKIITNEKYDELSDKYYKDIIFSMVF